MTAAVILNVVLAVFIVTSILSVLGWGIVRDRQHRQHRQHGQHRQHRQQHQHRRLATPDGGGARLAV